MRVPIEITHEYSKWSEFVPNMRHHHIQQLPPFHFNLTSFQSEASPLPNPHPALEPLS